MKIWKTNGKGSQTTSYGHVVHVGGVRSREKSNFDDLHTEGTPWTCRFKHGLMVKIHVRSTILLSVPNLSQNCPESMKINEIHWFSLMYWAFQVITLCIFFRLEIFIIFKFGQKIVSRNCVYYVLKYIPGYSSIPKFFYIGSYRMTSVKRSIKGRWFWIIWQWPQCKRILGRDYIMECILKHSKHNF